MPNLHYVFTLWCPQCGAKTHFNGTKQNLPPPRGYCGACLTSATRVTVEIIHVEVFKGAPPCDS